MNNSFLVLVVVFFFNILYFLITRNKKKFMELIEYRFEKGWHFSLPRKPGFVKMRDISFLFKFTKESEYILTDPEKPFSTNQLDWNKLTGLTINPLIPMGNTVMLGWRYNPLIDSIQVVPYWHRNAYGIVREMDELLTQNLLLDTDYLVNFKFYGGICTFTLLTQDGQKLFEEEKAFPNGFFNRCSTIQPYFGGTKTSPSLVKVYLKIL